MNSGVQARCAAYTRAARSKPDNLSFEQKQRMVEEWKRKNQGNFITDCKLPNRPLITKNQCKNYQVTQLPKRRDSDEESLDILPCKRCLHNSMKRHANGKYVTTEWTANKLNINIDTVRRLLRKGRLTGVKLSVSHGPAQWLVLRSSVDDFQADVM